LSRIGGGTLPLVRHCQLLTLWKEVVDERVGRQTNPVKIRNQVLSVETASPVWAQELKFLKPALVEKFNALAGEQAIKDIRFKAMGGDQW
jgi:predicted nucleic acid-binding Zn ribbon protein